MEGKVWSEAKKVRRGKEREKVRYSNCSRKRKEEKLFEREN